MSKIQYAIKVRVVRNREVDNKEVILVEGLRKLCIVPAVAEEPPMSVGAGDDDYTLSKTKSLKKGVFSGKLGKITVSAAQPNAIVLPAPSSESNTPANTMATVNLRFDPHENSSQPPRLGGLTTKLKVSTFYAARPTKAIPTHRNTLSQFEQLRSVYDQSISLSSRCVESVAWTKHTPSPAYTRRDSASSTSSDEDSDNVHASTKSKDNTLYYSATILVPITLPSSKTWVPTFHNCITSRVYAIDMNLTIHTPGTGVPASSVALYLPIQIAAASNHSRRRTLTAEEAAAELADVDEYLRPRVIEMPSEDLRGNSVLAQTDDSELPPSYEAFSRPQRMVDPGRG
jgi:hypothetical protein